MQIIPRAIDYFTGKALEYEDFDDDEDFEDMDDDDEDDDEFDNDVCLYPVFFCPFERLLISHPPSHRILTLRRNFRRGDAAHLRAAARARIRAPTPRSAISSDRLNTAAMATHPRLCYDPLPSHRFLSPKLDREQVTTPTTWLGRFRPL